MNGLVKVGEVLTPPPILTRTRYLRSYQPSDWHRSSCYVVLMECIGDDNTGITSMPLDFRSFDSAEARSHHGLNVLVANAGTFVQEYTEKLCASDGHIHPTMVDDDQTTRR